MTTIHSNGQAGSLAQVTRFYLWACAVSWAVWTAALWLPDARTILMPVGTFGPLAAALISHRASPARGLSKPSRVGPWWSLVLLGPPAVMLAGIGLASIAGYPPGGWSDPSRWYLVVPIVGYVAVFGGPLGEEPGWRGFALDRLQSTLRPVPASLVLGVAWAVWHWPLFLVEGTVQQDVGVAAFAWQVVVTSVFYTWIWNRTHSLGLVIAFHAIFNASVGLLPIIPATAGTSLPLWMSLAMATALASVLVVVTGGRLGLGLQPWDAAREPRHPRATAVTHSSHLGSSATPSIVDRPPATRSSRRSVFEEEP